MFISFKLIFLINSIFFLFIYYFSPRYWAPRHSENHRMNILRKVVYQHHYKKTEQLRRAYCGGCKNRRYMSPIAALFWPAAVHEIYCGVPYACRNSSSILRRTIAAG